MSGREFFDKYSNIINAILKMLYLLPFSLRYFIFASFSGFPGKIGIGIRYILFKTLCKYCGDNVYIGRWCSFKNIKQLVIGNNVSIHDYCYLDAQGSINIGSEVSIAHNSTILSFEHTFLDPLIPIKYQPLEFNKVIIYDDVWIGCGCRILSGVTINSRSIIGANSVVKNEIGPGIYVGSIAQKVRDL